MLIQFLQEIDEERNHKDDNAIQIQREAEDAHQILKGNHEANSAKEIADEHGICCQKFRIT